MVFGTEFERNRLLRGLTADEQARWLPMMEPVELPRSRVLQESGCTPTHVYFPTTAIVSIVNVTHDGASAEVAMVGNEVVMTQELIANMLGVRREGVTEGALKLQAAGLIRYARGHIWVLDRVGLEARACECYVVIKSEYERLLPQPACRHAQPSVAPGSRLGRQRSGQIRFPAHSQ